MFVRVREKSLILQAQMLMLSVNLALVVDLLASELGYSEKLQ
jgi:hypothetical protein